MRCRLFLLPALLSLASCESLGLVDNGTKLAFLLERSARQLLASGEDALVAEYEPIGGPNQAYEIKVSKSLRADAPFGGYLTVTGKANGGTSYHGRFVDVPQTLHRNIENGPARLTLRNTNGRVNLVSIE